MTILHIDTRESRKIKVAIEKSGKRFELTSKFARSQVTLPLVDKLLKKHKISLLDIDHIKVETGPGSFTGLKVGIAIANALSLSLLKPVNDINIGESELPQY